MEGLALAPRLQQEEFKKEQNTLGIESESRMMVARGWWKGEMGSECLMGRISVGEDNTFWSWMMDGGDGCTTV